VTVTGQILMAVHTREANRPKRAHRLPEQRRAQNNHIWVATISTRIWAESAQSGGSRTQCDRGLSPTVTAREDGRKASQVTGRPIPDARRGHYEHRCVTVNVVQRLPVSPAGLSCIHLERRAVLISNDAQLGLGSPGSVDQ
jgi:hypothetical protein